MFAPIRNISLQRKHAAWMEIEGPCSSSTSSQQNSSAASLCFSVGVVGVGEPLFMEISYNGVTVCIHIYKSLYMHMQKYILFMKEK